MYFLSPLGRFSFAQNRRCHFLKWSPNRSPSVRCIVLLSITRIVISKAGVDERKPTEGLDEIGLAVLSFKTFCFFLSEEILANGAVTLQFT